MDVLTLVLSAALTGAAPAPLQESAPAAAPAVAGEEAAGRALWDAIVRTAVGDRSERVVDFVLEFDLTRYSGEGQANETSATYRYMEPGWVRMTLESGRERLRGPEGDWLIDKAGAHKLVGRDFKQDIAELDESVAVARTFAHLTDPRGLRMQSLRALAAAPAVLPPKLAELAGELDWLRLESRDFRGPPAPGEEKARPDVLELGVERKTRLPRVAVLTDPARPELALTLGLEGSIVVDGFRVPSRVTAWRLDPTQPTPAFSERQDLDLWFKQGTLAPKLERADFLP